MKPQEKVCICEIEIDGRKAQFLNTDKQGLDLFTALLRGKYEPVYRGDIINGKTEIIKYEKIVLGTWRLARFKIPLDEAKLMVAKFNEEQHILPEKFYIGSSHS